MAELRAEVVIVGAGHSGLFLACALALCGFEPVVVDPAPLRRGACKDGRHLALLRGSRELAERLGLWRWIAGAAFAVDRVAVWERPGGGRVVYRSEELDGLPLAYGVEHAALRDTLSRTFADLAGEERFVQDRLVAIARDPDWITARLAGGMSIRARLLVGADGRRSSVRALAGLGARSWTYPQSALTLVVEHEQPTRGTITEILRPGGPLALLPLASHRSGITWVEERGRAEQLFRLGPARLLAELARESAGLLGRSRLLQGPSLWPLGAHLAARFAQPRLLLIGDAAHGLHPIHAQGFNLAVADAGALLDLLAHDPKAASDPGRSDVLLRYRQLREGAARRRLFMTDLLNRIFSSDDPLLGPVRTGVLELLAACAPLRRAAMWQGMVLH